MPNQPPLNPDALEAAENMFIFMCADGYTPKAEDAAESLVSAYLAVAQPEVNSVEELAKAWHEGFCKGEQTAFRERPVNPDTINPYKNGETP